MLKVSVRDAPDEVSSDLEGRLAGPWVWELERCWQGEEVRAGSKRLSVRLRSVTFIDEAGKGLLVRMFDRGVKLEGAGCLLRAILAAITHKRQTESTPKS
jgi:anti-anti-sigma regulatory factor